MFESCGKWVKLTGFFTGSILKIRATEIDAKKKLLEISKEAIPLPGSKTFFLGAQVKESKDSGELGKRIEIFKFFSEG